MLESLEPEVVLQYIGVSIEVIANSVGGKTTKDKKPEYNGSESLSAKLDNLVVEDTP